MRRLPAPFGRVLRVASLIVATTLSAAFAHTAVGDGQWPTLEAETLAGRRVTLPADLPGARTLVLMAYERNQQRDLDTWVDGLQLRRGTVPWVEVPVIGKQNEFVRGVIDAGMRRGIPDEGDRDRTITLAMDRATLRQALRLAGDVDAVDVMVVDRSGRVVVSARGRYAAEKAGPLLDALAR